MLSEAVVATISDRIPRTVTATAAASPTGTALPIWRYTELFFPWNLKPFGKPWKAALSFRVRRRTVVGRSRDPGSPPAVRWR